MARHGDLIKKFWKPDSVTVDADSSAKLKQWMHAHGLSTAPGAIAMLLHSPVHRSARASALMAINKLSKPKRKGSPK